MKSWTLFMAAALLAPLGARAEEPPLWPRFRGPAGSGVADGQRPPVEFGPDRNVKWKVPVPSGLSSPIVAGDKLVITAYDGGKLYTIAYNRATGDEVWRVEAPAKEIEKYDATEGSPAASTPVTDGERIVSYFGSCGLYCYDLTGRELWKFELPPAQTVGNFGTGVSPILAQGTVVLVRDQVHEGRILAVDAIRGSLIWERPRQSPLSFCTPVVWDTPAGPQIAAAGHARMIGYDLKTWDQKWYVSGLPAGCCSSPVIAEGRLYYAGWSPGGVDDTSFQLPPFDDLLAKLDQNRDEGLSRAEAERTFQKFFDSLDANQDGTITRDEHGVFLKFLAQGQNSVFALHAGGTGDVTQTHVLWKQTRGLPYVPTAIVYRGQCVLVKDGGIVTAYDAQTGDEVYQQRLGAAGKYYASPVAANGHIYLTSLEGVVTVTKAGRPRLEIVARTKLGERTAATPAIADNTLYVRTAGHLYAFADMTANR